jgi:glycosyltransferase involved in cell wall biosynthesis
MMVNLALGISALGHPIDLVVRRGGSPYLDNLPDELKLVELDLLHKDVEAAAAIYLADASPLAILTSKEENDIIATRAKKRSLSSTRIVIRVPVNVTSRLKRKGRGWLKRWIKNMNLRRVLAQADSIIAVSDGVASDISLITGIPLERIHVIRNPVVTPQMEKLAEVSSDHEWFSKKDKPVLLGIGRLGSQKNFEILIRAFCIVRLKIDCRLMILGEGRRRPRLEKLIKRLGVADSVQLPGFVSNPYPYLAKADLFVLSSLWEGSPNALTEALALGIPVVSTDCESGPREVLQNGKYGSLVPIGDVDALASAIIHTLSDPLPVEFLKGAVREYRVDAASRSYMKVLLGKREDSLPNDAKSTQTLS